MELQYNVSWLLLLHSDIINSKFETTMKCSLFSSATFSHEVVSGSTYGAEVRARYNTCQHCSLTAGPKDEERTIKCYFCFLVTSLV